MRSLTAALLTLALALNVSGCAHKGKLKTPSQIEADKTKKAREQARREQGLPAEQPLLPAFLPKEQTPEAKVPDTSVLQLEHPDIQTQSEEAH